MPVEAHEVHEKVRIDAAKPYGCHNRDGFKEAYHAPNRFAGTTGHQPIWWLERVRIPFTMSRECRYDMSLTDPRCNECKHRGSGEAYDAKIRRKGG
jgi:hypothetical protein